MHRWAFSTYDLVWRFREQRVGSPDRYVSRKVRQEWALNRGLGVAESASARRSGWRSATARTGAAAVRGARHPPSALGQINGLPCSKVAWTQSQADVLSTVDSSAVRGGPPAATDSRHRRSARCGRATTHIKRRCWTRLSMSAPVRLRGTARSRFQMATTAAHRCEAFDTPNRLQWNRAASLATTWKKPPDDFVAWR